MKYKEEKISNDVTLFLGDSREIIPVLGKIDACITDPPYGIEDLVGAYGRSARTIANDKSLNVCSSVCQLVAKHQKNFWLGAFYSCRITPLFFQAMQGLPYFGEIVWDKKAPGMGGGIRYQHENIAFFRIGEPAKLNDCFSILTYYRQGVVHPHEKPVQVMHNLLSIIPGQIVLDPFMGSGTTGVAAVQLKRKFIGIELDQKWFDIARKRISQAMKQEMLFT